MSENAKTLIIVSVGLAAVMIGVATRPGSADLDVTSLVGNVLTKEFVSPGDAKRLRIVRFDDEAATLRTFEVAEQNGLWTLPSKNGYPADATEQMAAAATALMDREILEVVSEIASDHVTYGVIDPLSPKLEVSQKGVGTRVTISGVQEQPLVDLIIGKQVKDSPGKHFVRKAEQSVVYVIEVDPSRLTTKFEDWIEKDLLKFASLDLQQVQIKDYSAELALAMTPQGLRPVPTWDPRAEMTVAYDSTKSAWDPVKLRAFKSETEGYVDFTLAEDEELNATALNDLKNALTNLKIVDVARKPTGMSEDLRAGDDFLKNQVALEDLMRRGFTAAATSTGAAPELISSDGEVIASMNNGLEYVLRFGNLVQVDDDDSAAAGDEAKEEKKATPDSTAKSGIHRYLFAMVRFNESAVKKPELAELPELPAGASDAEKTQSTTGESNPPSAASGESPASGEGKEPAAATDQPEAKQADEKKQTDEAKAAEAESKPAADEAKPAEDSEVEKVIAERKRIEADNQSKLDRYQATLKAGQDKVKELNLRFGDWYFVVGNDVFTKIRLSRDAIIKKKEKKDEASDSESKNTNDSIPSGAGDPLQGLLNMPGNGN